MGEYERWMDGQLAWEAEDGTIVYSASGVGSCIAELVWSRKNIQGQAPPDWLAKAYEDGKRGEKAILDAVSKTLGVGIDYETTDGGQHSGLIRLNSSVVVQWHVDGVELGQGRVVEAKLLAPSSVKDIQRGTGYLFEHYMDQCAVYSFAHEKKDVLLALGEKTETGTFGRLVDVLECTWEDDFKDRWLEIRKRIYAVEAMIKNNVEPKCMTPDKYPCFYLFMRPDAKEERAAKDKEKRTPLKTQALVRVAEDYVVALEREKVFKETKEAAARELHELINAEVGEPGDQTRYFLTPTGWGLTEVKVPDQTNWDAVWKFVEGHGGKKSDFLVPSGKTYFRISIPKRPGEKASEDSDA